MHDVDVMPGRRMDHADRRRRVMHVLRRLAVDFFLIVAAMVAYLGLYCAMRRRMCVMRGVRVMLGRMRTVMITVALMAAVIMAALTGKRGTRCGQYRDP